MVVRRRLVDLVNQSCQVPRQDWFYRVRAGLVTPESLVRVGPAAKEKRIAANEAKQKSRPTAAKRPARLTPAELRKHPIWVAADETNFDEEYLQPLNDTNLTRKLIRQFGAPVIAFRVEGQDLLGFVAYDDDAGSLNDLSVWIGGKWKQLSEAKRQTAADCGGDSEDIWQRYRAIPGS
jgi:hypothetical protein